MFTQFGNTWSSYHDGKLTKDYEEDTRDRAIEQQLKCQHGSVEHFSSFWQCRNCGMRQSTD